MVNRIPLVIHATHEAGVKVGGIGAVLDGLLSAQDYNTTVNRSILVGPMLGWDSAQMERLTSPRNGLTIRYSSLHGIFDNVVPNVRDALQAIEQSYEIGLLYGVRRFGAYEHEVILIEASNPAPDPINSFRYFLWQHYGIDSNRYSYDGEFNLYFSIAQPIFAALKALKVDDGLSPNDRFVIAHEWLGMPVVFAAQMNEPERWRTIFYAHETATARLLVEEDAGHDTRFYNALYKGREWGLDLPTLFGDQSYYYKDVIVRQAIRCDNIFAVGDLVVDELRFLGGDFRHKGIDLVYNGVTTQPITIQAKLESKRCLQKYCENLLGYVPDFVFTHVTRLVLSKALWRDLRVMEHLDQMLGEAGKTAVHFVLSTSVPAGRRSDWVHAWEAQYGWPVGHRGDNGDLMGLEGDFFFHGVEPYNQAAENSRVVFINQFGWSQERCGQRMPADMEFNDVRFGSDLEFGQSIYEPFGIAQVEPLNAGAITCVSNVCGCVGFIHRAAHALGVAQDQIANLVVADYVTLPPDYWLKTPWDALGIHHATRDWIESINSRGAAERIFRNLPHDHQQMQALIESGTALAQQMSWDVVARDYLIPGLERAKR
ncbi:MAG: hypothetical protein KF893_08060 [Caldilineaceae bacterium]|nr:hypothetical protein [Caldilineaceae bacterium]